MVVVHPLNYYVADAELYKLDNVSWAMLTETSVSEQGYSRSREPKSRNFVDKQVPRAIRVDYGKMYHVRRCDSSHCGPVWREE